MRTFYFGINEMDLRADLHILLDRPLRIMNALRFALMGLLLATAMFGQSSKLREFNKLYFHDRPFGEVFADEAIILPRVYADARMAARYDRINRDLDRVFSSRKKPSFSVVSDRSDDDSWRHSLEESPVVEYAMMGAQDIKKLKSGFTIKNPFGGPDIDAYLKSGIAWHPKENKHLTYTLGKRTSLKYAYEDGTDIIDTYVKVPLEKFNAWIEKGPQKLLDTLGL